MQVTTMWESILQFVTSCKIGKCKFGLPGIVHSVEVLKVSWRETNRKARQNIIVDSFKMAGANHLVLFFWNIRNDCRQMLHRKLIWAELFNLVKFVAEARALFQWKTYIFNDVYLWDTQKFIRSLSIQLWLYIMFDNFWNNGHKIKDVHVNA